ncbi:hypothetical protein Hamer_G013769, partial [Homarus americanus]
MFKLDPVMRALVVRFRLDNVLPDLIRGDRHGEGSGGDVGDATSCVLYIRSLCIDESIQEAKTLRTDMQDNWDQPPTSIPPEKLNIFALKSVFTSSGIEGVTKVVRRLEYWPHGQPKDFKVINDVPIQVDVNFDDNLVWRVISHAEIEQMENIELEEFGNI